MARSIQASIPRSRLLVIPGAMHCSVMESADAFNRALLEFSARRRQDETRHYPA